MGQPEAMELSPGVIELSADATWPAEENVPLGPWRLRATSGYSNRANSVRTACENSQIDTQASWSDLISSAEDFYRRRELPAMFHISPATMPANLDALLEARGYAIRSKSEVWRADFNAVNRRRHMPPGEIVLRTDPTTDWLTCALDESIGRVDIREQICRRIPSPRAFASAIEKGQTLSRALGVVDGPMAWLYCMATESAHQRRGLASGLLFRLIDWSLSHGATAMHLQVFADNKPAHLLYSGIGFRKLYDYHYRVLRRG